jgi:hypothetical protein
MGCAYSARPWRPPFKENAGEEVFTGGTDALGPEFFQKPMNRRCHPAYDARARFDGWWGD